MYPHDWEWWEIGLGLQKFNKLRLSFQLSFPWDFVFKPTQSGLRTHFPLRLRLKLSPSPQPLTAVATSPGWTGLLRLILLWTPTAHVSTPLRWFLACIAPSWLLTDSSSDQREKNICDFLLSSPQSLGHAIHITAPSIMWDGRLVSQGVDWWVGGTRAIGEST